MRLPLVAAFSASALAALSGCSSSPPAVQEGGFTVYLSAGSDPSECEISESSRSQPSETPPSASSTGILASDGVAGAVVTCSVTGSGPYQVNAALTLGPDALNIFINSLAADASATSPATGSVSYQSDATVATYLSTSPCNFWFANSLEGVDPGQVWVSFSCAQIANASAGSTCALPASNPSVAIFENCSETM